MVLVDAVPSMWQRAGVEVGRWPPNSNRRVFAVTKSLKRTFEHPNNGAVIA